MVGSQLREMEMVRSDAVVDGSELVLGGCHSCFVDLHVTRRFCLRNCRYPDPVVEFHSHRFLDVGYYTRKW